MILTHSPEEQWIITCLAEELKGRQALPAPPGDFDWQKAVALLYNHRLAGHFVVLLKSYGVVVPVEPARRLKEIRYGQMIHGDKARIQVKRVLHELVEAQVPVIVMKGWVLISTLYADDHSQRFCEDVDLLISPGDVDRAEALLTGLGYTPAAEVAEGHSHRFTNAREYFFTESSSGGYNHFMVGLHWGLTHYPAYDSRLVNMAELFKRCKTVKVADEDVCRMAPEDEIVYLCAHLSLHHRNEETLCQYFELAWLLESQKDSLSWEKIILRAKEWNYLVQVQHTFQQVAALFLDVIPADALGRIVQAPTRWRERKVDDLVAQTKAYRYRSALVEMLAVPGFANKCTFTFRQVFPEKAYLQDRYGLMEGRNPMALYFDRILAGIKGIFTLPFEGK